MFHIRREQKVSYNEIHQITGGKCRQCTRLNGRLGAIVWRSAVKFFPRRCGRLKFQTRHRFQRTPLLNARFYGSPVKNASRQYLALDKSGASSRTAMPSCSQMDNTSWRIPPSSTPEGAVQTLPSSSTTKKLETSPGCAEIERSVRAVLWLLRIGCDRLG